MERAKKGSYPGLIYEGDQQMADGHIGGLYVDYGARVSIISSTHLEEGAEFFHVSVRADCGVVSRKIKKMVKKAFDMEGAEIGPARDGKTVHYFKPVITH